MKKLPFDMEISAKKIIISTLAIFFLVVLLIGAFTFLRPQEPYKIFEKQQQNITVTRIEDQPGISNVRRFTDNRSNVSGYVNPLSPSFPLVSGQQYGTTLGTKPLPYPRIMINYSTEITSTIRSENTGEGYLFVIVTLDIRNYGYKYFDAYPTKFVIHRWNTEVKPLLNVSTGNIIDAVIPNNSRAKGDLVFKFKERDAFIDPKIKYTSGSYTILYNLVSPWEIKGETVGNATEYP